MTQTQIQFDWDEKSDHWYGQAISTEPAFEAYIDKPGKAGNRQCFWIVSSDWDSVDPIGAGFKSSVEEAQQAVTDAIQVYLAQRGS